MLFRETLLDSFKKVFITNIAPKNQNDQNISLKR